MPGSAAEREVVERLTRAYETADVDAVVALLTDDAVVAAPLAPVAYEGRPAAGRFLRSGVFRDGRTYRLIATRANGQPALSVRPPGWSRLSAHRIGRVTGSPPASS